MRKKFRKPRTIQERPADPSGNAEDLMGDTSGMTGITRGSSRQTSAEPDDVEKDTTYFMGGVLNNPERPNPTGIKKESYNNNVYNDVTKKSMSKERARANEETASEGEQAENEFSLESEFFTVGPKKSRKKK